jgi:hypothetical protein
MFPDKKTTVLGEHRGTITRRVVTLMVNRRTPRKQNHTSRIVGADPRNGDGFLAEHGMRLLS